MFRARSTRSWEGGAKLARGPIFEREKLLKMLEKNYYYSIL